MKKNKKPRRKIILAVAVSILVIFLLAILSDPYYSYRSWPMSIFSAKEDGIKAFYLSMEELGRRYGFDVQYHTTHARFLPDNAVAISIEPYSSVINSTYESTNIEEWVRKGNTYVIFSSSPETNLLPGIIDYENTKPFNSEWTEIPLGDGYIICSNVSLTNKSLKFDSMAAANIMIRLKELNYKTIVFNQYHNYIDGGNSLKDILGPGLFFALLEIGIGTILILLFLSDRFGSPVYVPETTKRAENENVYALASLYERTRSLNIALLVHMEDFIADLMKILGYPENEPLELSELIQQTEKDKRLQELGVAAILREYQYYTAGKPMGKNRIKQIIDKIENIRKEL